MDPEALIAALLSCLDEINRIADSLHLSIQAAGISAIWHSMLGIDKEGRPLTPIITWADTRPQSVIAELKGMPGSANWSARTGCPLHCSFLPAKLLWLQRSSPKIFQSVSRWISPGEYIIQRLCGQSACSLSMASGTGLLDQLQDEWNAEILAAIGMDADRLSPLVDYNETLLRLTPDLRRRWPALADAVWQAAAGDGACANLGSGCTDKTRWALTLGTSGAIRVMESAKYEPPPPSLWRYRLDRRRTLLGGALSNGGNLMDWFQRNLILPKPAELEQDLSQREPGSHGLIFASYLAGQRSPFWDGAARGEIYGLTLHTDAVDLVQAGIEAVAIHFARIAEGIVSVVGRPHQIVGGGNALVSSPAWAQMICDAIGLPLCATSDAEASLRGAALLAMETMGISTEVPSDPAARILYPDPERMKVFQCERDRQEHRMSSVLRE